MKKVAFSDQLTDWMNSSQPKTIKGLTEVFAEKSIAITILLLMFLPALPLPTAAHLLELIAMILAIELILGLRKLWLPKWLYNRPLGEKTLKKAIPFIQRRIRWFEKYSRPRLTGYLNNRLFLRFTGFILFLLALFAFGAPPFSGLDTLPALGAVIICLSLILGDMAFYIFGLIIGITGVALVASVGLAALTALKHLF